MTAQILRWLKSSIKSDNHSRTAISLLLATVTIYLSGCTQEKAVAPHAYDDCVLSGIHSNPSDVVIAAIKVACAQKFPQHYEFDEIAREQKAPTWGEVIARPSYQSMNDEEKALTQTEYFRRFIQPKVHPDFLDQTRDRFETYVARAAPTPAANQNSPSTKASLNTLTQEGGAPSNTAGEERIGEVFGAALAGTESIRMLSQDPACAYMFRREPSTYIVSARRLIEQAPPNVRPKLEVFTDEDSQVVAGLRRSIRETVAASLDNARRTLALDNRTACGVALGSLVALSKSANKRWNALTMHTAN